jgi:hypothetical protein
MTHAPARLSAPRFHSLACSPAVGSKGRLKTTVPGFALEIVFVLTAQHAVCLVHGLSFGASHIRR